MLYDNIDPVTGAILAVLAWGLLVYTNRTWLKDYLGFGSKKRRQDRD